ncbi:uncharacterized protein APUU_21667S [Aspergillus puulaauensis]|uniref:Rhodopsin domain-containing protein n=1 Tax=Aspergillus puulaauensis TaxID=1220207 RepID=A0A7R8AL28_9EURO|nr:uncharacterized protein APUU_21667S [Aspergillus puulaauensis]BCS21235.1 hypothetical protein APUU_21667S [Aspergillus puulaauensis]
MTLTKRGGDIIATVTVLVGLSIMAVCLRVFARYKRRVRFDIDDYLCFLSAVLLLAMLVELILWVLIGGNGSHQEDLSDETMKNFYKIFLANEFTYFLLSPAIKISIVCFYRRVFTVKPFQWASFAINTLIALWGAAIFIACGLQCRPLRSYWDHSINGTCFDSNEFIIVNQIFNVIMDFVILALPVPMIWNLQRAWQDKLALNGVFALGGFVCFASIYRIVVLFWISPVDITYTVYQATLWTHIEPSIGLICSCLPIIRGLFPKLKLSGSRKATAPYYIKTDVTSSHFALSSARSPASEFFKLEDKSDSRSTTNIPTPNNLGPLDIQVRTDIDIEQAGAAPIRSHT